MQNHKHNPQYQLVKTRLQHAGDGDRVECGLCLWRCRLGHGQRGFCQAHVNRFGTLYNLTYGIVSAMDVGPIEDKPVRHFRAGSRVMSVGSYGCNLRCDGCHNLTLSWGLEALDQLAKGQSTQAYLTPQQLVDSALQQKVQGIAFTYSEPAVWLEFVLDVAALAKQHGLYTVYVSNSFVTHQALQLMAPVMDVLCSDIKSFSDDFYAGICRKAKVADVLDSIKAAQDLGIHVETRTNIIPGKNDDHQTYRAIAGWIHDHLGADSPWHITKFFPAYRLSHLPPTPTQALYDAQTEALNAGLNHVYVYDDKGCDCARENKSLDSYVKNTDGSLFENKKCAAQCCGDDGVLLKKYEMQM